MPVGTYLRWTAGSWRLVDFLGAGGMGEVYRAVHLQSGRVAALKILTTSSRSPSFVQRFCNEARILSTLQHPNIAAWYDTVEADGRPGIVMEYVTGHTLEHRLQRGALSPGEALPLFATLCDAVSHIHERGIIHRDLKANNVKIDEQGVLKLLDFGIAKAADSPKLTTDGSVVGTLHYLSPEQVRGEPVTPASDVWALGVLLHEMLTGHVPFGGDSFTVVMARILKGAYEAPSLHHPGIPADAEGLIARCLKVDPKDRVPSAGVLRDEVRRLLAPAPLLTPPARRHRWSLILSAGAALVAGTFAWRESQRLCCAPAPLPVLPIPAPGPAPDTGVLRTGQTPSGPGRRSVVIKIFEGTAEVLRNGAVIGHTPFTMDAPIGEWLDVTLRQSGFEDLRQRFQVSDGPNEFQYTMQRSSLPSAPPRSDDDAALLSSGTP